MTNNRWANWIECFRSSLGSHLSTGIVALPIQSTLHLGGNAIPDCPLKVVQSISFVRPTLHPRMLARPPISATFLSGANSDIARLIFKPRFKILT